MRSTLSRLAEKRSIEAELVIENVFPIVSGILNS